MFKATLGMLFFLVLLWPEKSGNCRDQVPISVGGARKGKTVAICGQTELDFTLIFLRFFLL